jgi:hypothetical protein
MKFLGTVVSKFHWFLLGFGESVNIFHYYTSLMSSVLIFRFNHLINHNNDLVQEEAQGSNIKGNSSSATSSDIPDPQTDVNPTWINPNTYQLHRHPLLTICLTFLGSSLTKDASSPTCTRTWQPRARSIQLTDSFMMMYQLWVQWETTGTAVRGIGSQSTRFREV